MLFEFMDFGDFAGWYAELGKLKIFWAKPVKSISLLSEEKKIIGVRWIIRGKIRDAVLFSEMRGINLEDYRGSTKILIVPETSPVDLSLVDARSVLYFWDVNSRILEPNEDVEIKAYSEWGEGEMEKFKGIHKLSWGFFVQPRQQDHLILLAFLESSPVGMAYLNVNNFNIDCGIHVMRPYWRRRIGTALLAEILRLAKSMGAHRISVVRVFRSVKGTAGDMRAVEFYRANNPCVKMSVYRIKS
ncbi:GNAT family N-acetyltransferase [Candidatus Korarchaeum cryptofilum]|jgi:GNAT superfamily N-acetyltransferase|uniref:GNAT family N-acetyltransferase n=1 Tax=Candidatus Korarchaeum cryptofilum TaxID=498846 RepID=A0A3R9R037_9CREN|nr:GNAT family N-acetyltransferase [Candidatus Korarchaeum cryptofilum]